MTAELELHHEQPVSSLGQQMDYARAVSTAAMLPDSYRGKPADIMLAVSLGQSMGLSPAESLYRISVIKGKPTASAELIAANVRKAGHRLRVRGDETTATATIIRADDPDYEFEVTRDMAWAQRMGLADQPNYRKQPGTMLQWRAITAVARLACPEALYGVSYTPDELEDIGEQRRAAAPSSLADRVGAAPTVTAEQVTDEPSGADNAGADAPLPVRGDGKPAPESPMLNTSGRLAKRMFALMGELGITDRDNRLVYVSDTIGRQITTSSEMTDADAEQVIASLERDLEQPFGEPGADA